MSVVRAWMLKWENRQTIPADELQIVSGELKFHAVGIKGGNMFTITYSVLWNVS